MHGSSSLSDEDLYSIYQFYLYIQICVLTCRNIVVQLWISETYDASLFTDIRV